MRAATRGRSINLFYLAALATIIFLGIDFAVNFLLTDPQQRLIYSDISSPLADLLAAVALLIAAQQSASHSKRLGLAWAMIGLSALAFAVGDIIWAVLELGLSEPPFPSLADVFYLIYYPLLLAGVLLLPEEPATRTEQIKKLLDAAVVLVAALLGLWNFLIGPVIASNADYPLLEQAILLAYPLGDFVLLWALTSNYLQAF